MSTSRQKTLPRIIVSGGQTGVDRAALDVAIYLGLEHGGWCPRGRRAEDGVIPTQYELQETDSRDYSVRTERNVVDSDGTLILYRRSITGGTRLTVSLARKHNRPCFCFDLDGASFDDDLPEMLSAISEWMDRENIGVLNIAGPRESTSPGIAQQAQEFLIRLLTSPA